MSISSIASSTFFLNCGFMILDFFDVARSTSVSALSFRWIRPKYHVALSGIFVCVIIPLLSNTSL